MEENRNESYQFWTILLWNNLLFSFFFFAWGRVLKHPRDWIAFHSDLEIKRRTNSKSHANKHAKPNFEWAGPKPKAFPCSGSKTFSSGLRTAMSCESLSLSLFSSSCYSVLVCFSYIFLFLSLTFIPPSKNPSIFIRSAAVGSAGKMLWDPPLLLLLPLSLGLWFIGRAGL